MRSGDRSVRVKGLGDLFRNLRVVSECYRVILRAQFPYQGFRLFYVFVPEEELPVQVREIDGVEVNDVDVEEAAKDEVLQELAANAPSSNHQDA